MSNYHYNDQSGCSNCQTNPSYAPLKDVNNQGCAPKCIDRLNTERSVMDRMYFNHFVLNKPWNIMPPHHKSPKRK